MRSSQLYAFCIAVLFTGPVQAADERAGANPPDYNTAVAPIFKKYCVGCHSEDFAEGELLLDNFAGLMQGGETGAAVVPGKAEESRLILMLEKKVEPFMPPEGSEGPTDDEIALLKAWVTAGAKGPAAEAGSDATLPATPRIEPLGDVRQTINAVAYSPDGRWIAVGRFGRVEILSGDGDSEGKPVHVLDGHAGQVNSLGFSTDGSQLLAAAGEPGLFGQAVLWNTDDWTRIRTIQGHGDSLCAAALSPEGKLLVTGSYDQTMKVWDAETGEELRELTGHNGPVFDLAFHPSAKILASAGSDATVKLWDVSTGERVDTLNQPEKEQYAVAFSPDGKHLVAGGVDNRIRVWEIRGMGREGTNPLAYSRFAHEEAILNLTFSPDGRLLISSGEDHAVKVWETEQFTQQQALPDQSDWVPALAVSPDGDTLMAGRLDGTLSTYPLRGEQRVERPEPIESVPVPTPHGGPSVEELPEITEVEPNDHPDQATPMPAPGIAHGVLLPGEGHSQDADHFRFESAAGQTWVIETNAARQGSPADTKIDVLDADGAPVLRYLLRAVRDSYIEFRPINSIQNQVRVKNWEEMELNQYLYMGGEVCRLFRAPEGPDSAFLFYTINGKRRCYFDTSGTIHAKEEPVYIVEAYPPGTELVDNGLPVFPLYYSNDDDGERKLGNDSRLTFSAPSDGTYVVRVTDVRGFGGEDFKYSLTVREPQPDFSVTVEMGENDATVGAGSGQGFTVKLDRIDNFEGDVRVEIEGLPAGFHISTPIVVQAGHLEAQGVLSAAPDAVAPPKEQWSQVEVTATATIHGENVTKKVGDLGEVELAEKPKLLVALEPDPAGESGEAVESNELILAPGTTTTAMLRIERNGADDAIRFDVDNLPHGVIVDNLGLNGITLLPGQTERQIFLTAAEWVPPTSRLIHAVSRSDGKQASSPIVLHVRNPDEVAQVKESKEP